MLEIDPPKKIVFSYGYAKGMPIPAGESRVTIQLDAVREGTRVRVHLGAPIARATVERRWSCRRPRRPERSNAEYCWRR